ncbi:hypothetical protein ACFFSY_31335 [Paenibacillus aurantiacus]|uniref:Uncharacterized protein n=1 Tax=Paenibacillus aurantiacus TaxID=1936118 RepID=A0ABV5KYZ6_9BACL
MAKTTKLRDFKVTGRILAHTAQAMLPFYRKVSQSKAYARSWSDAVVNGNLEVMEKLLRQTVTEPITGLSTNGIGYFVDFKFAAPIKQYTNGTTIPPGTVQFRFSPVIHRRIAREVIPFYERLAGCSSYAAQIAKAVREHNTMKLRALIRPYIQTNALRSIRIDFSGIRLAFRYADSRYTYVNVLFREIVD